MRARSELDAVDAANKFLGRAAAIIGIARDCMVDCRKGEEVTVNAHDLFGVICQVSELLDEAQLAVNDMNKYRMACVTGKVAKP